MTLAVKPTHPVPTTVTTTAAGERLPDPPPLLDTPIGCPFQRAQRAQIRDGALATIEGTMALVGRFGRAHAKNPPSPHRLLAMAQRIEHGIQQIPEGAVTVEEIAPLASALAKLRVNVPVDVTRADRRVLDQAENALEYAMAGIEIVLSSSGRAEGVDIDGVVVTKRGSVGDLARIFAGKLPSARGRDASRIWRFSVKPLLRRAANLLEAGYELDVEGDRIRLAAVGGRPLAAIDLAQILGSDRAADGGSRADAMARGLSDRLTTTVLPRDARRLHQQNRLHLEYQLYFSEIEPQLRERVDGLALDAGFATVETSPFRTTIRAPGGETFSVPALGIDETVVRPTLEAALNLAHAFQAPDRSYSDALGMDGFGAQVSGRYQFYDADTAAHHAVRDVGRLVAVTLVDVVAEGLSTGAIQPDEVATAPQLAALVASPWFIRILMAGTKAPPNWWGTITKQGEVPRMERRFPDSSWDFSRDASGAIQVECSSSLVKEWKEGRSDWNTRARTPDDDDDLGSMSGMASSGCPVRGELAFALPASKNDDPAHPYHVSDENFARLTEGPNPIAEPIAGPGLTTPASRRAPEAYRMKLTRNLISDVCLPMLADAIRGGNIARET